MPDVGRDAAPLDRSAERDRGDLVELLSSSLVCWVIRDALEKRAEPADKTGSGVRQQEQDDPALPDVIVTIEDRNQIRRQWFSDRSQERSQRVSDGPVGVLNPPQKLGYDRLNTRPALWHGPICSSQVELVDRDDLTRSHSTNASDPCTRSSADQCALRCDMRAPTVASVPLDKESCSPTRTAQIEVVRRGTLLCTRCADTEKPPD